ncbi:uncharacterized protein LOC144095260 [Amblyomma americanum]
MKSVKQFLNSFGANGKGPERLKFPGEDGPVTTLDVRPDILVSTKKDFSIKNGCRPDAPDIRMATNASGKPFPVICNVRTKDHKTSKPGTRNETSPPRSGGVRTFRKCPSTTDAGAVPSDSQDRACGQAAKRPPLTLRVSSVPSRADELGPTRSMLPPPTVTAALTKRRSDEPRPDSEKRERQDGCVKSQTSSSGLRTMKRSITERTPLNEGVTRGDHNVNGLPQLDGHALTRIPRFTAAPVPAVPPRVQKPVAQKPSTLRRSTSDISQNGCTPSGGAHGSDRVNGRPPAPGAAVKGLLKPAASFSASQTNERAAAASAGQTAVTSEDGSGEAANSHSGAGNAAELEEAPAAAKTGGNKGKSKSRCQRRIWSFSLPRFMRSHSSPKLNTESVPGEESRSSTLPRLKSAEDADLSAANGGEGHLFKITSLTSLHDLPAQGPPKTCFSQGDLNQATTKTTQCQRIVIREPPDVSCRSGQLARDADGNVTETKTSSSLTESHSSSDNGTDHSGTERPYVMPPRALRKYIKTNFRRLNMQEAAEADVEKKDGGDVLKVVVKAEPLEQEALSTTSDKSAESVAPSSSLLSSSSSITKEWNGSPKSQHYLKEPEVSLETLSEFTEKVVTDRTHTASYTKEAENDVGCASKAQQSSSPNIQRLSPPMTCFDVDAELFSEHAGIHRAIPATVSIIGAVSRLSISETPGPRATPAAQEMDTEIPGTLSETPVRVLGTSAAGAPSVQSLDVSEGSTQGSSEKTVTGNDGGGCPCTEIAPPAKDENVPEELDRQVDGASCTESLSSFESEVTLPEKQERRTHAGISRKLRVLDRPSYGAGAAATRKPGAGTGPGCCSAGAGASACCRRTTANSKRQSCGDRVRQLENEVWQTERELLLLKEKVV